jgi:NTP pyrophosphatase (non-canonical NTP hydrolase)
MIDLNKLAKEAHGCALRRGKITNCHSYEDFMKDLAGEIIELTCAGYRGLKAIKPEVADVILVCLSTCIAYGITDIEAIIKEKHEYNLNRKD